MVENLLFPNALQSIDHALLPLRAIRPMRTIVPECLLRHGLRLRRLFQRRSYGRGGFRHVLFVIVVFLQGHDFPHHQPILGGGSKKKELLVRGGRIE